LLTEASAYATPTADKTADRDSSQSKKPILKILEFSLAEAKRSENLSKMNWLFFRVFPPARRSRIREGGCISWAKLTCPP
jgi:hypothetical protein